MKEYVMVSHGKKWYIVRTGLGASVIAVSTNRAIAQEIVVALNDRKANP